MTHIIINVEGAPVPKQSTRFDGHGHAHTDPRIKAWQEKVAWAALQALPTYGWEITDEPVKITCVFSLPDKRRRDLDNLMKAVKDALNDIVWQDDCQVQMIDAQKVVNKDNPGVTILVEIIG